MSSLHDPFDLLTTEKDMDNVVPFLASNKINQMIDTAVARPQLSKRHAPSHRVWWSGGMATAACIILLLTVFSPLQMESQIGVQGDTPQLSATTMTPDDMNEFSELVMLDTLDSY